MKCRAAIVLLAIELCSCGGGGSPPMPAPADLSYPSATAFVVGTAIKPLTPTVSGTITGYSVSPALPAGLSLNSASGAISGTPSAVAAKTTYTVTASNATGSTEAAVTIQVWSGVLLDLGHVTPITGLQLTASRALSQETSGHCILWDTTTDAMVTSFACSGSISMAGATIVIAGANSLQVLATSDGQVQATITTPYSWWQLAPDGSYIATGSTTGLTAWSPTGESLYSSAGDYSKANAFAAVGQIQVALGPLGQSVIQTISLSTGASSLGPAFQGAFSEWFVDGSHFQTTMSTTTSTTVWTYSSASVQQDQTVPTLPSYQNIPSAISGTGNWFWVTSGGSGGSIDIYAVGASQTPALSVPNWPIGVAYEIASGATLALMPGAAVNGDFQVTIVDLSGASAVEANYTLPIAINTAYAATSASNWYIGNSNGVLLDGKSLASTPKFLTLGAAWSIASGGGLAAVGTASGQIVVINPQTQTVQNTIAFSGGSIQMSPDGMVLAAMSEYSVSLNVYSLPAGTLINSFGIPGGTLFALAPSGQVIATGTATTVVPGLEPVWGEQVTAVTGGPVLASVSAPYGGCFSRVFFSPDGTLIAASEEPLSPCELQTNIYKNYGNLAGVSGWAVGWIDNSRLLVNNYNVQPSGVAEYTGATIYSPTGAVVASPKLQELTSIETINSDQVYSPSRNSIYSLSTGATIFGDGKLLSTPSGGTAVAGYAVFPSGSLVRAVPY
jgi:hypothetical protein